MQGFELQDLVALDIWIRDANCSTTADGHINKVHLPPDRALEFLHKLIAYRRFCSVQGIATCDIAYILGDVIEVKMQNQMGGSLHLVQLQGIALLCGLVEQGVVSPECCESESLAHAHARECEMMIMQDLHNRVFALSEENAQLQACMHSITAATTPCTPASSGLGLDFTAQQIDAQFESLRARELELAERRPILERREAACSERDRQVSENEKVLACREASLNVRSVACRELKGSLQDETRALEQQRRALAVDKERLVNQRHELQRQKNELQAQSHALDKQKQELDMIRSALCDFEHPKAVSVGVDVGLQVVPDAHDDDTGSVAINALSPAKNKRRKKKSGKQPCCPLEERCVSLHEIVNSVDATVDRAFVFVESLFAQVQSKDIEVCRLQRVHDEAVVGLGYMKIRLQTLEMLYEHNKSALESVESEYKMTKEKLDELQIIQIRSEHAAFASQMKPDDDVDAYHKEWDRKLGEISHEYCRVSAFLYVYVYYYYYYNGDADD